LPAINTSLQQRHTQIKYERRVEANGLWKQAGIAIHIPNKEHFKPKLVRRDKEGSYVLVKGTIHQEDTMTVNIYALDFGATDFIKQTL
jgi:hypothetical protein